MLNFITIFKNMVVEWVSGCSEETSNRSYLIIHSVSVITVLPIYVILPLQGLQDKKYKTLIL